LLVKVLLNWFAKQTFICCRLSLSKNKSHDFIEENDHLFDIRNSRFQRNLFQIL